MKTNISKKPSRGAIAVCSLGRMGLITSEGPVDILYPNGERGKAWTGIHLEDSVDARIGDPWSSREPRVLDHLENVTRNLLSRWRWGV